MNELVATHPCRCCWCAFQHVIQPRLTTGKIEIFVIGETFVKHRRGAAADPGGVAYLIVRRHGVDGGAAQRVGYHCQVVRLVIQQLALQTFVAPVRPGAVIPGFIYL